jgi:hypothetical protein
MSFLLVVLGDFSNPKTILTGLITNTLFNNPKNEMTLKFQFLREEFELFLQFHKFIIICVCITG